MKNEIIYKLYNLKYDVLTFELNNCDYRDYFDENECADIESYIDAKKRLYNENLDNSIHILEDKIQNQKNSVLKIMLFSLIADFYLFEHDYLNANEYYVKGVALSNDLSDFSFSGDLFLKMAIIAIHLKQYDRSTLYFNNASSYGFAMNPYLLKLYPYFDEFLKGKISNPEISILNLKNKMKNETNKEINILSNYYISRLYQGIGDYSNMLEYSLKVLSDKDESYILGFSVNEMYVIKDIVACNYFLGNYHDAVKYAELVHKRVDKDSSNTFYQIVFLRHLISLVYLNKTDEAFTLVKKQINNKVNLNASIQKGLISILNVFSKKVFSKKELLLKIKEVERLNIDNSKSLEETKTLKKVNEKFGIMYEFVKAQNRILNLNEFIKILMSFVGEIFDYDIISISFLNDENTVLNNEYVYYNDKNLPESSLLVSDIPYIKDVIQFYEINPEGIGNRCIKNKFYTTNDYVDCESSMLCFLYDNAQIYGICSIQSKDLDIYDDMDVEIFEYFSSIISAQISLYCKKEKIKKIEMENEYLKRKLNE